MAYVRRNGKPQVTTTGSGQLRYPGFNGPIDYEITGCIEDLRPGGAMKAAITTTADIAADAFRQMRGYLQLACGREYRVNMVAHTAGSGVAYVELTL